MKNVRLVDLSQPIFSGAPVFPGHPETKITIVDTLESTRPRFTENYGYTTEKIEMSTHGTTHVDWVSHSNHAPGAPAIDQLPLEWFYTEAICLHSSDRPPKTYFTVPFVEDALQRDGSDIRPGVSVPLDAGRLCGRRATSIPCCASRSSAERSRIDPMDRR